MQCQFTNADAIYSIVPCNGYIELRNISYNIGNNYYGIRSLLHLRIMKVNVFFGLQPISVRWVGDKKMYVHSYQVVLNEAYDH